MVRSLSEIENSSEVAELRAEIASKRDVGEVLFEIKQLIPEGSIENCEDVTAIIDSFVTQLGYSALGNRWKEINLEAAHKVLIFAMTKDLAYSVQLMSLEEAEQFSTKIFNFFSGDCRFFTNTIFVNNYSGISAWDSLTKATFDTGVVILSNGRIGIVWVLDED